MSKLFFVLCRSRRTRQMYIYKATWAIYVQSIHKMMMMILIEDMQSPSFPASNLLIFHSFFISYHSIVPSSSLFIISGRQAHPPNQHVHALPFFLLSSWSSLILSCFLAASHTHLILIEPISFSCSLHARLHVFFLLETSSTREKFVWFSFLLLVAICVMRRLRSSSSTPCS